MLVVYAHKFARGDLISYKGHVTMLRGHILSEKSKWIVVSEMPGPLDAFPVDFSRRVVLIFVAFSYYFNARTSLEVDLCLNNVCVY